MQIPRAHPGVEAKAKLLQDNNQETYRALADEVFKTPRVGLAILDKLHGIGLNELPSAVSGAIKDKLVYAEMQYRQGHGKPVTEQQVADLHNMLVKHFGLPAYAMTDKAQVRYVRMSLLQNNPTFMGYGIKDNMKVGDSITEELSPLQAVHLALEVAGEKLMSEDFQVAPGEWKAPEAPTPSPNTPPTFKAVLSTVPKFHEMRDKLVPRANNTTPSEAFDLLGKGLDALGIGR